MLEYLLIYHGHFVCVCVCVCLCVYTSKALKQTGRFQRLQVRVRCVRDSVRNTKSNFYPHGKKDVEAFSAAKPNKKGPPKPSLLFFSFLSTAPSKNQNWEQRHFIKGEREREREREKRRRFMRCRANQKERVRVELFGLFCYPY